MRNGILRLACLAGALSTIGGCGGGSPSAPTGGAGGCGAGEPALAAARGYSDGALLVEGACREYVAYVPASYDASRAVPLVVALHGYTGNPRALASASGLSDTAEAEGFIVVYPAGLANAWDLNSGGRDVRFLRALVPRLQQRASLDARRLYATGFSMGGGMAHRAACDLSDVFAAIAPISGSYQGYNLCGATRPVPVFSVHGAADPVVPPVQNGVPVLRLWLESWAVRNRCDLQPQVSEIGGLVETSYRGCAASADVRLLLVDGLAHGWWGPANQEIWDFFAAHPFAG